MNTETEEPSTPKEVEGKKTLYCSFCGKSQHEVRKLIAGPTVFICDECVELCQDIIKEETRSDTKLPEEFQTFFGVMVPKKILTDSSQDMNAIMATVSGFEKESPTAFARRVGQAVIRSNKDEVLALVQADIDATKKKSDDIDTLLAMGNALGERKRIEAQRRVQQVAVDSGQLDNRETRIAQEQIQELNSTLETLTEAEKLKERLHSLERYRAFVEEITSN